jgi:predicted transcriptional regulator
MDNPYHWLSTQSNLFYGKERTLLIEEIINRLQGGESFAILGGRRLGKTTLLRRLEQELRTRKIGLFPVYIDAQTMPEASTSQEAFEWIRKQVCSQLGTNLEGSAEDPANWIVKAAEIANCLRLVLLIDEFDMFREYPWSRIFFNNWRAIIHNIPDVSRRVAVVLAGGRRMLALQESPGSPLANVLAWKYLSVLSKSDNLQMVNEPTGGRFGEEFAERVWLETGGHPFLIQFLMHHVCGLAETTSVEEALAVAKDRFLEEHDIVFRQWWFDHLEEDERQVYRLLSMKGVATLEEIASGIGLNLNAIRNCVRTLSWVGIVRWSGERCERAGNLFDEWVRDNDISKQSLNAGLANLSLHELYDELERAMRSFVITQLKRFGYLNNLPKLFPDHVQKANLNYQKSKRSAQDCPLEELLEYGDFSWPFEIILSYWKDFYQSFSAKARDRILGKDPNKAKQRFEERKDVLTEIRNAIRHARAITDDDREKARVFCRDIIALMSVASHDSDAR